jgi:ABC-2 type transport system ATP-binding protein
MSILVDSVVKYYREQKVLKGVSFCVEQGQVIGFLGPNGAGKSTMMKILVGLISPTQGRAFINEMDVETQSLEVRRITGYLPEHNPLYLDMYVQEYLHMIASVYKLKNIAKRVSNVIDMTGITPERKKKIGQLSKGFRQRVGLAQTLLHDPEVLILDEPTTGLDPNQIVEIRNLIKEIGHEKTVMLSTHIMQEVEAICNRVVIINKGAIVANEPIELLKLQTTKQIVNVEFVERINKEIFNNVSFIENVENLTTNSFLLQSKIIDDIRPLIFKFAVDNNLTIVSLQQQEKHLEDIFRQLTSNNNN